MEHTTIAVDLAKSVFQVAVSHHPGHVDEERRLSRDCFLEFFAQRPPATVLLEAWGSAHYWARQLQPFGHAVRLLAPHDVRPYVRRNKRDRTDAKGLLEAHRRFIPSRSRASRTKLRVVALSAVHLALDPHGALEYAAAPAAGIRRLHPVGAHHVLPRVRALLADATGLPLLLLATLTAACDDIDGLEANMRAVERQIATLEGARDTWVSIYVLSDRASDSKARVVKQQTVQVSRPNPAKRSIAVELPDARTIRGAG